MQGIPRYGQPVAFGEYVHPPATRLILKHLTAVRYNPLGVVDVIHFGVQRVLFRKEHPVTRSNYVYSGVRLKITPTSLKPGVVLELAPLSVLTIQTSAQWMQYFHTFNSFQSFASAKDDYADKTLSERADEERSYATSGLSADVSPILQFRVPIGKKNNQGSPRFFIAIRNQLCMAYHRMNTKDASFQNGRKDPVWYSNELDTLASTNGWTLQNRLDVILMTRIRLNVGVHYEAVRPIYRNTDFRTAKEADSYRNENSHHRLGPLIAYRFFDRAYTRFNRPTLIFSAHWYLSHRWRHGAEIPTALPYMLLAFSFQSDFLHGPQKN
ncbi:MAG: hypothetical protein JXR76_09065 [Deltaproteobacteria bacterium]|nr:hypothetical protein [Deltaproteobacteria bacterium]